MGAKQSKRSVDISGKDEGAGAGEVAAAGAVGEGRVEQLADVDALKPQLNGDAHIHEKTDKEKQLDSGTPENEKDATTEKEGKEQENESEKEKEAAVTNGDSEPKAENGDSTPTSEDGKKPKKEKVKKKWSLRSISFSRKDKPKQEKKQKEEEPKTNGEPEKVPEEAAEATPESAVNETVEEAKSETEIIKDEKTPETPVTEPLTNGSSTPESPKVESPSAEEPAPAPAPAATPAVPAPAEPERQEPKPDTQPEQLPVNGLSLEEPKPKAPEAAQTEESKPEEQPTADTTETVPAPEIPVKIEVCVEQMPLESTPPPLPANPPPSSVVSFAATTMAPELTDASLPNTTELVISAPHSAPDTKLDELGETPPVAHIDLTNTDNLINPQNETVAIELPSLLKELEEPLEMTTEVEIEIPLPLNEIENKVLPSKEIDTDHPVEIEIPSLLKETDSQQLACSKSEPNTELKETSSVGSVASTISDKKTENVFPSKETDSEHVVEQKTSELAAEIKSDDVESDKINIPVISATPIDNVLSSTQNDVFGVTENEHSETKHATGDQAELQGTGKLTSDNEKLFEIPEQPDILDPSEDLPPPSPLAEDDIPILKDSVEEINTVLVTMLNSNRSLDNVDVNGSHTESINDNDEIQENLKNKTKDSLENVIQEIIECNGNLEEKKDSNQDTIETGLASVNFMDKNGELATSDDSAPPSLSEANDSMPVGDGASNEASEAFPPPPSELESTPPASPAAPAHTPPQEPLPVSDKLADLIPEVPVVPDLKTETLTETTSDVAVAN